MKCMALLVEGVLDEAVGRRIIEHAGATVVGPYGKEGIGYIKKNLSAFAQSAQGTPMLALADLMDTEFDCPARVVQEWLPYPQENMLFRLVVREIESWILADRANAAQFLGVPKNKIPCHPEELDNPKRRVINLARHSRHARARRLLVPPDGSTATEGRAYTSEMQKFVRKRWNLKEAARRADSLKRCVTAVTDFFKEESQQ